MKHPVSNCMVRRRPAATANVCPSAHAARRLRGAAAAITLLVAFATAAAGQTGVPASGGGEQPLGDVAAPPAPVTLGGEAIIVIQATLGTFTPAVRAARIEQRLQAIVHDKTITDPTVTVSDVDNISELRVGPALLMGVTEADAEALRIGRRRLAQAYAEEFDRAIRAERARYTPEAIIRGGILAAVATVALLVALWILARVTHWLHRRVHQWRERRLASLKIQHLEVVSQQRLGRGLDQLVGFGRLVAFLVLLDVYLTYVLGRFPWTRQVSVTLIDYALDPLRAVGTAFLSYLPSFFFLLVIALLTFYGTRLVGVFFRGIEQGRIHFESFPAEWADPTNKVVRVLVVAFALVVAFPYLPGSGSPAFAGVSVFVGVLFSLASSSSLSNMIAGLVLTYTNAFYVGDRIKLGEAVGDVVARSLLATRLRTTKNVEITIPNAIVLGHQIVNYSKEAKTTGLILHTTVTIGYDAPWRQIHELLIKAATATPGILEKPAPFVLQTALNDFYVSYEINAYTDRPNAMAGLYSSLHANIQDVFFEAGVEIMSPHYTSLRDGHTAAIPEQYRPADYDPPRLRLDSADHG